MPSNGRFKFGVRCKFYFGEGEHEVQWVWKGGEGTEKRGPSQPRSSRRDPSGRGQRSNHSIFKELRVADRSLECKNTLKDEAGERNRIS